MIVFVSYALISTILVLASAATYLSVNHLSLPQETLTIITIALPIIAFLHTIITPLLVRRFPPSTPSLLPASIIPDILQLFQLLITVILATLLFSIPAGETCALSSKWQALFAAKDAIHIKAIQDAFHCCGFRTVKDRAWPFDAHGGDTCSATFGYTKPCAGPWAAERQKDAIISGVVVVLVGLLQGLVAAIARWREARGVGPWWEHRDEWRDYERSDPIRRPLLGGREDLGRVEEEEETDEVVDNVPEAERPQVDDANTHRLILPGQAANVWNERDNE